MASPRITMRIEPELKSWLEEEAKRQDRSASYLAKQAIEAMKAQSEAKQNMIREAVEQADKGEFVSSEAVHKWMDSWDTDEELPIPTADISLYRS